MAEPFTDRQIALLQNFATQAVIATENARLLNELRQSLLQQTATADVLKVISSSLNDLKPVFETIGQRAEELCNAEISVISVLNDDQIHLVSIHGTTEEGVEAIRRAYPMGRDGETLTARAIRSANICHVPDVLSDPFYQAKDAARAGKYRAGLAIPMIREREVIGAIFVARQQPGLFADAQVQLLKTFADQAVIAIENVRLFNETKEALDQQTATADVLKTISRSSIDLETVLDTLVETVARLCRADQVYMFHLRHDLWHLIAACGLSAEAREFFQTHPFTPGRGSTSGRAALERRAVLIPDVLQDPEYTLSEGQEIAGYRTTLGIPLLREDALIGIFSITRTRVEPFTDKEIELATSFADQAVIAIENARLFEELRERTTDLTESLEQQTATANVLEVISRSAFDLQSVFETVVESSARLCGAYGSNIFRFDGEVLHIAATFNVPQHVNEWLEQHPIRPGRHSGSARVALERRTTHVPDVLNDPEYSYGAQTLEPYRTILGVPILKGDHLLGVLLIYNLEVKPFTDKQIALVETFADQAAIAIENVRLLEALRQRTDDLGRSVDELRALGEVSHAVNSTLDLETVLTTIVAKAVQLSGTEAGAIYVFDELQRELRLRATYGMDQEMIDALTQRRIGLDDPNVVSALAQSEPIQVADLRDEAPNEISEITLHAGFRARLLALLMRGEDVVGLLVVRRRAPGAFPQNTVDLIKTFAAQSAVAIENARLFRDVEASLEDLRTAQDRLVQTQKLASLGQLTAGIAHEIKNPLNFVNNFAALSSELTDELSDLLKPVALPGKVREEVKELTSSLKDNLGRVVQHGKRADSIVKNMLLHSRAGSGEHRPVEINAIIDESLNLAYHGARAEKPGFNITLERDFDPGSGVADIYPQEVTRVFLNLISNGFYAATKRAGMTGDGFEPKLKAVTRNLGDRVEVRIRDNGTGIPPDVQEKIFNPFFTTKPAGEGTGLGLSMSHDIVVKQHGGTIEVATEPGSFTEFIITLPRVVP